MELVSYSVSLNKIHRVNLKVKEKNMNHNLNHQTHNVLQLSEKKKTYLSISVTTTLESFLITFVVMIR
jgi:hypothetical protein